MTFNHLGPNQQYC